MNSALMAFQTAADVSPDKLSLWIRSLILIFTLIWGAWQGLGFIHHFNHADTKEIHGVWWLFRVFIIVTLLWSLVFI